jgi:small-conductance mechanosensitive channel
MNTEFLDHLDPFRQVPVLQKVIADNTVYAYLLSVITFVIVWYALKILRHLALARMQNALRQRTEIDSLVEIIASIRTWSFPCIALYVASLRLNLSSPVHKAIAGLMTFAIVVQAVLVISAVATLYLRRSHLAGAHSPPAAQNTARNLLIIFKAALWVGATLFFLDNIGINVTTFIAGLGIGGVAIALATQTVLADTFNSFAIALDKPFEAGDSITVGDLSGTVEHIGLKTTRIRSFTGELLIFGNSDLTGARIKNFKQMQQRRVVFSLFLSHDTEAEKVSKAVEAIRKVVKDTPEITLERAHFNRITLQGLEVETCYFVSQPDYKVYMDAQQALNLRLLECFAREGIKIAHPPQPAS